VTTTYYRCETDSCTHVATHAARVLRSCACRPADEEPLRACEPHMIEWHSLPKARCIECNSVVRISEPVRIA
jgi:hypothetical protein